MPNSKVSLDRIGDLNAGLGPGAVETSALFDLFWTIVMASGALLIGAFGAWVILVSLAKELNG